MQLCLVDAVPILLYPGLCSLAYTLHLFSLVTTKMSPLANGSVAKETKGVNAMCMLQKLSIQAINGME